MDRILRKGKSAELLASLHATVRRCLESSSEVHGLREEVVALGTKSQSEWQNRNFRHD